MKEFLSYRVLLARTTPFAIDLESGVHTGLRQVILIVFQLERSLQGASRPKSAQSNTFSQIMGKYQKTGMAEFRKLTLICTQGGHKTLADNILRSSSWSCLSQS